MLSPAEITPITEDLVDEYVDRRAESLRSAFGHELVSEAGELFNSAGDFLLRELAGQRGRLGAILVGVAENADSVQPRLSQEGGELGHVFLGFTGEADDEVRPDPGIRRKLPDLLDELSEPLAVPEPAHCPQYAAAGVLEGQIEVPRYAGRSRQYLDETRPDLARLKVAHADPADTATTASCGRSDSSSRRSPRSLP